MPRVLVLGDDRYRGAVADAISTIPAVDAVDCDPALGDCVMYVRLEGARYDAFVFLGWNHPVTRGGLAIVAERSVLLPVLEPGEEPHLDHDAYLFRLPRALGFRDAGERVAAVEAVPKAAAVPARSSARTRSTPLPWVVCSHMRRAARGSGPSWSSASPRRSGTGGRLANGGASRRPCRPRDSTSVRRHRL